MKRSVVIVFIRGMFKFLFGAYKNPQSRIDEKVVLESSNNEYSIFKQTELNRKKDKPAVLFEIEFTFKDWVPNFFSPTIAFFIGMPGFISKLWLVDHETGRYAGQYVFASKEDAEGYGNSFAQKLVKRLCIPGKHSWNVTK